MKKRQSILAIIIAITIILGAQFSFSIFANEELQDKDLADMHVFLENEIIDVEIEMDESDYDEMLENAMKEEYYKADVTINGEVLQEVAIRPKGNSSLRDVAMSDGERYSFKIDINRYIDDQNLYGLTKINLNNCYMDPSYMAEYIGYDILSYLDADASRTVYVSLTINGEFKGLYLAVEEVNKAFLEDRFGNDDGELYKPDMGVGADLAYFSDDVEDYVAMVPQDEDMTANEELVDFIKAIDLAVNNQEYDSLDDIFDVDSFLKYLAMSSVTVHLDAYQGGMYHNYYLYYDTDIEKFRFITWDLNMIFNGFPMSGLTDEEATEFLIDEPYVGDSSSYPLIEAVLNSEENLIKYHEYLDEIVNGYFSEDKFNSKLNSLYELIQNYVEIDPSAFFDYETFKKSIFSDNLGNGSLSILSFVEDRVDSVNAQLLGQVPSTNNKQGNEGTLKMPGGMAGGMRDDNAVMTKDPEMMIERIEAMLDEGDIDKETADEILEYLENGEMPPMELMQSIMGNMRPDGMDRDLKPSDPNLDTQNPMGMMQDPEMLIEQIESMLKEGDIDEETANEILEYLENGEMPPMDLMQSIMGEMIPENMGDMQRPTDNQRDDQKDNVDLVKELKDGNEDEDEADDSNQYSMLMVAGALILTLGVTLFLKLKKF